MILLHVATSCSQPSLSSALYRLLLMSRHVAALYHVLSGFLDQATRIRPPIYRKCEDVAKSAHSEVIQTFGTPFSMVNCQRDLCQTGRSSYSPPSEGVPMMEPEDSPIPGRKDFVTGGMTCRSLSCPQPYLGCETQSLYTASTSRSSIETLIQGVVQRLTSSQW
ncbi:hypothetical protein V8C26DRAFT_416311 [Trichoderma gracile]